MAKSVILMRHGKAQTLAEGQTDFDRVLTEAGARSLQASLPSMLSQFESDEPVAILSSPAARALQTAQLLQKALKSSGVKVKGGIAECEALWEQDLPTALQALAETRQNTAFVVGHNPFIESALEYLTGDRISFATGAMACVNVALDASGHVVTSELPRLLWFSQGPVSQRWKTLVQLESILSDASDTMNKRFEAFMQDPADIETLHKLRVSIRTLRSLTSFIKPWQENAQNARMQQTLKEVVAFTSRQRELDVFAEQASKSQACSESLVTFCAAKADENRADVIKELRGKANSKRLLSATTEAHSIRWKKQFKSNGLAAADVRAHFDDMAAELDSSMEALSLADAEQTHDVRKQAKRVRYAAENFKGIIGDDAVEIAKSMTAHQDNLGAICDARINIDMINSFIEDDIPEEVSWDLALLRAQNETFLYSVLRADAQKATS